MTALPQPGGLPRPDLQQRHAPPRPMGSAGLSVLPGPTVTAQRSDRPAPVIDRTAAEDYRWERGADYERGYALLRDLVAAGDVVALTGAGMSTESGIPDYRGPDGQRRVTPMTYADFVGTAENRQRYWARAFAGWRRFSRARANDGHHAVAELERSGHVRTVVTQNVDGLHQRAGSVAVIELHGNLDRVACLDCGTRWSREVVHSRMAADNPDFGPTDGVVRPDGDVVLPLDLVARFRAPTCANCGSDRLKPDVVYFGESVPKERATQAMTAVEGARALVVLGSSLQVMSGYRFVRRMVALDRPVAICTIGRSRGDGDATIRLHAGLGVTMTRLSGELAARG